MKLLFKKLLFFKRRANASLEVWLNITWRIVSVILTVLLVIDGVIFYEYGLGRANAPISGSGEETIKIQEENIKAAAKIMGKKRADFEAAETAPADFPSPFR